MENRVVKITGIVCIHALFLLGFFSSAVGGSQGVVINCKIGDVSVVDKNSITINLTERVFGGNGNVLTDGHYAIEPDDNTKCEVTKVNDIDGWFRFDLPFVTEPRYISIYNRFDSKQNIGQISLRLLVWPGDSVSIVRTGNSYTFSGRDAHKFACLYTLSKYESALSFPDSIDGVLSWFKSLDSLTQLSLKLLQENKEYFSSEEYAVAQAGILCYFQKQKYFFIWLHDGLPRCKNVDYFHEKLALYNNPFWTREVVNNLSHDATISHCLRFLLTLVESYKVDSCVLTGRAYTSEQCVNYLKRIGNEDVLQTLLYFLYTHDKYSYKQYLVDAMSKAIADNQIKDKYFLVIASNFVKHNQNQVQAFRFRLSDRDSVFHTTDDYLGKVVLLDFWYVGCGPCVQMHSAIDKIKENLLNKDLTVITICLDNFNGNRAKWLEALNSKKYTTNENVNLFAPGSMSEVNEIARYYNITGCPSLILVSRQGKVVMGYEDPRVDEGVSLRSLINSL